MSRFWHPFSNLAVTEGERLVLVRGDGATVEDDGGREYFDATAGLWYSAVGHGNDRIAAAIGGQAATLESYSCFGVFATDVTLEVADRIAAAAPVADSRVFLTSGGSDSVDTAAKIARRHFALRGLPEKTVMVAREHSYHGTHAFGTSLGGISGNREGWGTLVSDVAHVPPFDVGALEATIESVGSERVAAFFVEPVIGAGGVYPPPEGYLRSVAEVCRRAGILLVCDEVVTGVGRLGSWSASERYGVSPDLMILAKALTSGYQPLGAVVVSGEVAEPFLAGEGAMLKHGYTYSGHATACAAALANLDVIAEEGLIERAARLAEGLPATLGGLADLDGVAEVRTVGFTAAIQLDEEQLAAAGVSGADVVAGCRERGQLTRLLSCGALHFSPPFVAEERQIERFAEAVAETVDLRAPASAFGAG
ncbi:MAG: aminotransferase class III-fold pyridoxal phosphate-dependent enzyme [Solirubrobacterales bacterium]